VSELLSHQVPFQRVYWYVIVLFYWRVQELLELRVEIKEARRITMLHAPSKVMDMEYEISGLREQLSEKSLEVVLLRKKVTP
jgi:hypothetical protein